jgi:sulfur carrier protein ThiS
VTVTVNGRPEEAVPGETVESLLDRLGLAAQYALVGEPVERARYGDTALEEGDTLVVARTPTTKLTRWVRRDAGRLAAAGDRSSCSRPNPRPLCASQENARAERGQGFRPNQRARLLMQLPQATPATGSPSGAW